MSRAIAAQLGLPPSASVDLLQVTLGSHLTLDALQALRAHGFSAAEIHRIVIPQRTATHRRTSGQTHLSPEEADRAVRLARVTALAERAFGDRERAFRWLRKPKQFLHDAAPLDVLTSSEGARVVEERLVQLEHGLVA